MIDTIILEIKDDFTILDYGKFKTTKEVFHITSGFNKWINNPTVEDKRSNKYKPRLTLIKRGVMNKFLKIEFSAPKLIFNNNLRELEEKDFPSVVEKVKDTIREMGVLVSNQSIENAKVLSFHPSKNIKLNNGYTATFAIKELSKVDISQRFDIDIKDYRNSGKALQFYTRLYSVCIYDKINDFLKPPKRSIDKKQVRKQTNLFESIKKKDPFLEVLRIEVRIIGGRKMKELLSSLDLNDNPIFIDIFQKDICQKILLDCWEKIFFNSTFVFIQNNNPQKLLEHILAKNPKIKIIKAIKIIGLIMLSKDEDGIMGLRQIIDAYTPKKTNWAVVKRYLRALKAKIDLNSYGFIEDIENEIMNFEPLVL